jgi:hypothetical protein
MIVGCDPRLFSVVFDKALDFAFSIGLLAVKMTLREMVLTMKFFCFLEYFFLV